MNKTYEVIFADNARPGVFAVGGIRRGQSAKVGAAEALRLVETKGLSFANPDDKAAASRELTPSPPSALAVGDSNEEQ